MELLAATGIIIVFAVFGVLMMTENLPTFVALGGMAIGIGLVGGMGVNQIVDVVIFEGSTELATAFTAVFFGAALGAIIEQTGIAENMVKSAAELGGDSPFIVGLLLYLAVAAIATSISGLGAFIMIATIVFPIMVSIGFTRKLAAGTVLLAYGNGVMFNPANWVFYTEVTGINLDDVIIWAVPTGIVALLLGVSYVTYYTRTSNFQETWAEEENADERSTINSRVPTYSLLSPVIPVVLVIAGVEVLTAFIIGILFAAITSKPGIEALKQPKTLFNQVTRAFHDGISNAAPAIALMVTIGWLLKAVFYEGVSATMEPLLSILIPENMLMYAAVFIVLAPLALYRGPLNLWGLGSGIIGVLAAIGINPALITTTAVSALRVQAPADPTNTHNAWASDELDVNVNALTKSVLPFAWVTAGAGVVFSVVIFGI
ncbi:GntT/GntP/DsdX family permease [Natronorubrum halophilum]|uniref:GntT/GntP/DsdX family permease n=1 Tax=Natronorubrum halophilum TaxID=1702106 RepID=UPI0010C2413B|nr:citrate transporter [Natronorubrum halophilum]